MKLFILLAACCCVALASSSEKEESLILALLKRMLNEKEEAALDVDSRQIYMIARQSTALRVILQVDDSAPIKDPEMTVTWWRRDDDTQKESTSGTFKSLGMMVDIPNLEPETYYTVEVCRQDGKINADGTDFDCVKKDIPTKAEGAAGRTSLLHL